MRMTLGTRRRNQRKHKARLRRLGMLKHPKAKVKAALVSTTVPPKGKLTGAARAAAAVARAAGARPAVPATPTALAEPAELSTQLTVIGLPEELTKRLDAAGISNIGNIKGWSSGALRALGITTMSISIIRARLADKGHHLRNERPATS
jgi:hypothetical protein